ncbi:hypothetical protein ACFL43_02355 [Thermodesulfobacteriota bacterium]
MSLWLQSLSESLDICGKNKDEIAKCILRHLSMTVPRSWWTGALQNGIAPQGTFVDLLVKLRKELHEIPALLDRVGYDILIALAFLDDERSRHKIQYGSFNSPYQIEDYLSGAQAVLSKHPELKKLSKAIEREAVRLERNNEPGDMEMNDKDNFVIQLADEIALSCPDPAGLSSEAELENNLVIIVEDFVQKHLDVTAEQIPQTVYGHVRKKDWTASKKKQNVVAYGCSNTSDIFIEHHSIGSVYIELKLAKKRGEREGNSLPGDLQRSIGQSIIASMRHPYVICFIACQGKRRNIAGYRDYYESLTESLWEKHRIALRLKY